MLQLLATVVDPVHHHHPARVDYAGVAVAALIGWVGLPGPGEAALVAAGVLAARHRLDIGSVLAAAWVGAAVGGTIGWLIGLRAGRAVLTAPGPLLRVRLRALERGERFYTRYGALGVYLMPSWVAGIHRMPGTRFVPYNAVSALVWALIVGLGSFLVGPAITELADDIGTAGLVVLGVVFLGAGAAAWRRRSRGRTGS